MKKHSGGLDIAALNIDHLRDSRRFSGTMLRSVLFAILGVSSLVGLHPRVIAAQQSSAQTSRGATIQGVVRDSAGRPIADASVRIEQEGVSAASETETNKDGAYEYYAPRAGAFTVTAEKSGLRSRPARVNTSTVAEHLHVDLTLEPGTTAAAQATPGSGTSPMEFADAPNFTVAAVTDWTAAGGHGSDASLRTSEALTRETLTLKPQDANASSAEVGHHGASTAAEEALRAALAKTPGKFDTNHELGAFYLHAGRFQEAIPLLETAYKLDPQNEANEYDLALALKGSGDFAQAGEHVNRLRARGETADINRLAGELAEKLGDPLTAVHRFEQAAREDPSEQNYFEWGSELLLHRAVLQARDVFTAGAKAYPRSARMLTALGAALFAGAFYDEAALRLCDASDLDPAGSEPYLFMGKVEIAAPNPLSCVEQKLARFVELQPENPLANYYYAMTLWKQEGVSIDAKQLEKVEVLLTKAVSIDPKCSDAYLQLGELNVSRHDYQKAIGFYNKAIEVDPQLSEAHYRLGMAYDRVGDRADAAKEFQLHDEIRKQQAAAVDRQRREVKQFLVVEPEKPVDSSPSPR